MSHAPFPLPDNVTLPPLPPIVQLTTAQRMSTIQNAERKVFDESVVATETSANLSTGNQLLLLDELQKEQQDAFDVYNRIVASNYLLVFNMTCQLEELLKNKCENREYICRLERALSKIPKFCLTCEQIDIVISLLVKEIDIIEQQPQPLTPELEKELIQDENLLCRLRRKKH